MSRYQLSEAYSEIYDHRKIEDSFDNLRFIDYMLDEDIEEVVESLVWEFRDYGNTLSESFDILSYAASDKVICESYDQFIEDVLTEATVTKGKDRAKYAGSAAGSVTYGRGDADENARLARKLAKQSGKAVSSRLASEAEKQANQRKEARRARVDGAISRVKSAMAGAKGSMGRAVKTMGGAVVERGKALLKGLLRRGGKAMYGAGTRMIASGSKAASAPATTRTARVGGKQVTVTSEPAAGTGSTRKAVGRAIRKVGVALQRKAGKKEEPKMTRADYEQRKEARSAAAKTAVGDAFAKPKALPPARPETATRRAAVQRKLDVAAKGTTGTGVKTSTPRKALPASTSGQPAAQRQISARKAEAAEKLKKATRGSVARGVRFAAPGARLSTQRASTGVRERAAKFASQLKESDYYDLINFILEDIMNIGYAQNESDALDILESLTEDGVVDIALEYIND